MKEIINNLYLGSYYNDNLEDLRKLGFTHSVNLSSYDNFFPGTIESMRVDILDLEDEPIDRFFDDVNTFISNALKSGGKIIVYCSYGVSRSPTLIFAFLIKIKNFSYEDALSKIPEAEPNPGFLDLLKKCKI